jgi:hypothetical protein
MHEGKPEPRYQIMQANSADGLTWTRTGRVCIPYRIAGEANSRPTVWYDGRSFHMLFCFRGSRDYRRDPSQAYRLGYAVSSDGLEWERRDDECGLTRSESGWDSEMVAYSFVFAQPDHLIMLYVGNGFGAAGFGWAESPIAS